MTDSLTLPLFPLPNVVLFPGCDLELHIFEPRYRQLIEDLEQLNPQERRVGMLLMQERRAASPAVYPRGTAGRLVQVARLGDGRSNIVLHGEFAFDLREEVESRPYRRGLVEPVREVYVSDVDPAVIELRDAISACMRSLARDLEAWEFDREGLADVLERDELVPLVNFIASVLDVSPQGKLLLLEQSAIERAQNILSVLRSRRRVLELLSPYRHLQSSPGTN